MFQKLISGFRVAPRYSICLFYFVLGFVFVFPSVNIWLLLKQKTGLDPGRLAMQMQVVDLPWLFKPVYAWMSDRFPIAGYRRKTYVGMFSLYCSIAWVLMPASLNYLALFYLVWGLENLFLCVADVVVDALIVERVKIQEQTENRGSLQSIGATCRSFGKCVGSLLGALMFAEGASSKQMFYITALAPLCVALCSFWIDEKRAVSDSVKTLLDNTDDFDKELVTGKPVRNWRYYMRNMFDGFIKTDMWKFCMVATMYTLVPEPGNAYFYYYQDIMHIPNFELQIVGFAHEMGLLFGNFIFIWKLRKTSPRILMTVSTMVVSGCIMWHAVLIFLLPFSMAVKLPLIYAYEFVTAVADVFLYMPLLIIGAQLVTEGVEGTSYALVKSPLFYSRSQVLSIQNLGGFLDSFFASQIMNLLGISEGRMDHLWYMSFLCAFLFLAPLTALNMIPEKTHLEISPEFELENKSE